MAYYPMATEAGAIYRLVGPDGSTAVFNDPLDSNYVGALTEVTGLDSAEVRESASDMVEADGGAHGSFYLGRRPITLTGRVFGHATIAERAIRLDRARRASLALRGDAVLSWAPSWGIQNLLTNPSFEANDLSSAAWLPGHASMPITRVNTWHTGAGAWSGRVTGTTPAGTTFPGFLSPKVPSSPGRYYGARATVNLVTAPTGAANVSLLIRAWSAAGAILQDASVAFPGGVTPGVKTISVSSLAMPANTATVQLYVYLQSTAATAMDLYADEVLLTELPSGTATIPGYFDGDSSGMYWEGNAHQSQSGNFIEQFTTVRRQQPFRESGAWVKEIQVPLVSEFAQIFGTGLKTYATGVAAENQGNSPAFPIIAITGPASNPTVSDGTRTFRTTGLASNGLASGETVEFDMLNHTGKFTAGVRNGQSANRYIDFATTQWPYLAGLGTTQTFTLAGGGTATIRFRDTWA